MKFRHFAKRTFEVSFVLMAVLAVLSYVEVFQVFRLSAWASFAFFAGFTYISGYYICRSVGKPVFLGVFFGFFVLRLFLGIGAFVLFQYAFNLPVWASAISFMTFYAIYKVFETLITLKYVREEEALEAETSPERV